MELVQKKDMYAQCIQKQRIQHLAAKIKEQRYTILIKELVGILLLKNNQGI